MEVCCRVLQCVVVCSGVSHFLTVCCMVLQRVALRYCSVIHYVVVCCKCLAVCREFALQCVAVCFSEYSSKE